MWVLRKVPILGIFLSTLSLRRATFFWFSLGARVSYFYPRSPCGERRGVPLSCFGRIIFLSTLSLRRATVFRLRKITITVDISIHALLAESDPIFSKINARGSIFLSTLSLRRATRQPCARPTTRKLFLSTLSLRRATPGQNLINGIRLIFLSTLSLRRATVNALKLAGPMLFLSTLSLRRATTRRDISTSKREATHFYPRSPCGERQS